MVCKLVVGRSGASKLRSHVSSLTAMSGAESENEKIYVPPCGKAWSIHAKYLKHYVQFEIRVQKSSHIYIKL